MCVAMCSGVVDYVLECGTGPGVRVGASIYEYIAGMLWGGFAYPRSRTSAVYQVITRSAAHSARCSLPPVPAARCHQCQVLTTTTA